MDILEHNKEAFDPLIIDLRLFFYFIYSYLNFILAFSFNSLYAIRPYLAFAALPCFSYKEWNTLYTSF
jgi:hypothetical protein